MVTCVVCVLVSVCLANLILVRYLGGCNFAVGCSNPNFNFCTVSLLDTG